MPHPWQDGTPPGVVDATAYWTGYLAVSAETLAILLRDLPKWARMVVFADALALLDGEAPKGAAAPPAPKPAPVTPKPARPAPRRGLSPADVATARRIARDVDDDAPGGMR